MVIGWSRLEALPRRPARSIPPFSVGVKIKKKKEKDLRGKDLKLIDLIKEDRNINSLWIKTKNQPKLLMDLRSYGTLLEEKEWKHYNKKKLEGGEFFKLLKLCQNFVEHKISTRKKIHTFPSYKRGTRGFLLEDSVVTILPKKLQLYIKNLMTEKKVKVILFNDGVFTLPPEYFRMIKH